MDNEEEGESKGAIFYYYYYYHSTIVCVCVCVCESFSEFQGDNAPARTYLELVMLWFSPFSSFFFFISFHNPPLRVKKARFL